ncbi:MAG: UbiA-like polyprenyltransferase [Rikenellaceae bacterium]
MQHLTKRVLAYASLVKFSHSVFAMPFALVGFTYAYASLDIPFDGLLLIKVVACMIFARNTAMAFNRYADRKIDAMNQRTSMREIPAGKISARAALVFCMVNILLFIGTCALINPLCLYLSPGALFVVLIYSYAKRFTALCHIILGLSLAIAPVGAYIAVAGKFAPLPMVLSVLVITWVSGFDIIYALQDAEFDSEHKLNSIPSKLGLKNSLIVSSLLHVVSIAVVLVIAFMIDAGILYYIGAAIFSLLMVYQHSIVKANDLSRVTLAFGTVNGVASVIYGIFTIADLLI